MKKALALLLSVVLIISSVTCALVFPAGATTGENLWTSITAEDFKNFGKCVAKFDSFSNQTLGITAAPYQNFYIKMPELEVGAGYQFSFTHKTNGSVDLKVDNVGILTAEQVETANGATYNIFPSGFISVSGAFTASATESAVIAKDFTATEEQYYLAFRCNARYQDGAAYSGDLWPWFYVQNISLTKVANAITVDGGTASVEGSDVVNAAAGAEVALTFTNDVSKVFKNWEVVSGDVTLADATAETTTFAMPDEAVSIKAVYDTNLWTNVVSSDVGSYSGNWNMFGAYTPATKLLKFSTTYWQHVYVKMPELEAGKTYRLSMTRRFGTATQNSAAANVNYFTMRIVSSTKHTAASTSIPSADIANVEISSKATSTEMMHTYFTVGSDTTNYLVFYNNTNYATVVLEHLSLVEVPGNTLSVTGGTAQVSGLTATTVGGGASVTLTATPEAGYGLDKWCIKSGSVELADATAISTTFVMPNEPVEIEAVYKTNLWADPDANFTSNASSVTVSESSGTYTIANPHYSNFKFALPQLEADKTYRLAFQYCIPRSTSWTSTSHAAETIKTISLQKAGGVGYSTIATSVVTTTNSGIWETVNHEFAGTAEQLYLYFDLNYAGSAKIRSVSIIEVTTHGITVTNGTADKTNAKPGATVTVTADTISGKMFAGWQVVAGDVTLADATATTTSFIMPEEPVQLKAVYKTNLWTNIAQEDFGEFDANANAKFVGFSDQKLTIEAAPYQNFYIKMPQLEVGGSYQLSFSHQSSSGVDLQITNIAILTADQIAVANATQYNTFPSNVIPVGAQFMSYSASETKMNPCTFTAEETQYYLAFRCSGRYRNGAIYNGDSWPLLYVKNICLSKSPFHIAYDSEAARVEAVEGYSLTAVAVNEELKFTVAKNDGVNVALTYANTPVTPDQSGVYTVLLQENATLNITTSGQSAAQTHAVGVGLKGENLTKYNADVYDNPVWEGDTVYQEAVMFYNTSDGYVKTTKQLLYPIEDVISVRSADLKTWYVKGVDYEINANGEMVWLEGGKMPIYTGAFTTAQVEGEASAYYTTDATHGLVALNDQTHEKHTVYVTYKHSDTWGAIGYSAETPDNQGYDMGSFYEKLAANEAIDVLVYGDSTATGLSSTGAQIGYDLFDLSGNVMTRATGIGIKAPTFFEQATAALIQKANSTSEVNYYNLAYGGKDSSWGKTSLADRVGYMNTYYGEGVVDPDLIYVKFAANDTWNTAANYKANMQSIVSQLKELYPNATIILVSGKVNNQRTWLYDVDNTGIYRPSTHASLQNNSHAHEQALVEIADANTNCIVAKTTSVWEDIVQSKDEEDYLSNNINHANDFWAMVTAQVIVAAAEQRTGEATGLATAYNSKAAIRAEGSTDGSIDQNGLRIYNEVKTEWLNNSKITEFGSIAIRKNYLTALYNKGKIDSTALTLENLADYIGKGVGVGVSYSKEQDIYTLWKTTDGTMVFTSYLTGIDYTNFDEDYWIVAYAKDGDGNTYYSEIAEVCVYEVAEAIDAAATAGADVPEIDQKAFNTFVSANLEEYKAWYKALYGEEPTRTEFELA